MRYLTPLPVALSGSESRNCTDRGTLKPAMCSWHQLISSSALTAPLRTTNALPPFPSPSSGTAQPPRAARAFEVSQISGGQPAVAIDRLGGCGGIVEIALHDVVPARQDLGVVGDAHLNPLAG